MATHKVLQIRGRGVPEVPAMKVVVVGSMTSEHFCEVLSSHFAGRRPLSLLVDGLTCPLEPAVLLALAPNGADCELVFKSEGAVLDAPVAVAAPAVAAVPTPPQPAAAPAPLPAPAEAAPPLVAMPAPPAAPAALPAPSVPASDAAPGLRRVVLKRLPPPAAEETSGSAPKRAAVDAPPEPAPMDVSDAARPAAVALEAPEVASSAPSAARLVRKPLKENRTLRYNRTMELRDLLADMEELFRLHPAAETRSLAQGAEGRGFGIADIPRHFAAHYRLRHLSADPWADVLAAAHVGSTSELFRLPDFQQDGFVLRKEKGGVAVVMLTKRAAAAAAAASAPAAAAAAPLKVLLAAEQRRGDATESVPRTVMSANGYAADRLEE